MARESRLVVLAIWACSIAACTPPRAPTVDDARAPAQVISLPPIETAEEGTSRTMLQQYRARDLVGGRASIPRGDALLRESKSWELPFQSKRMVAALLTTVARGEGNDLSIVLAPDATYGRPDSRRPHARPVFGSPQQTQTFFEGLREAANRFDSLADYVNPTSFLMGVQEPIRAGSEPMWAYFEAGNDRLMFRFRRYGGRVFIDYVGFNPQAPQAPIDYTALGPAPPMMPGVRRDNGRVIRDFDPSKMNQRGGAQKPTMPGSEAAAARRRAQLEAAGRPQGQP